MSSSPEILLCCNIGAMANSLLQLAKLMQKGSEKVRRDFQLKLLALFSDLGLKLTDKTTVFDLGALLPAIAAACEGLGKSFIPVLRTRATPSFRALEAPHDDSGLLIKVQPRISHPSTFFGSAESIPTLSPCTLGTVDYRIILQAVFRTMLKSMLLVQCVG